MPSLATAPRLSGTITAACALIVLGATALNGATEHGGALLLRALVAAVVVLAWPTERFTARRAAWIPPVAAVLVVATGLVFSDHRAVALQALISVGLVGACYAVAVWGRVDLWPRALAVAAAVGGVHALWAMVQWISTGSRGRAGFFNPNDLAAWLVPIGLAAMARLLDSTSRRRAGWAVAAAVCTCGLVATQSRSGLAAAAIGALLLTLGAPRLRPLLIAAVLIAGLSGAYTMRRRFVAQGDPFAYSRTEIWRQSVALAIEHPFGVGLGGYKLAMRRRGVPLHKGLVRYPRTARAAHSEVLGAWAELGWLGLAVVLLSLWPLVNAWRKRRHRLWPELGVLAGFAVPAAVSSSLHVPPVAFLAALWAADIVRRARTSPATGTAHRHHWVAVAAVLLTACAVPATTAWWMMRNADGLRARGDLADAVRWADRAALISPWSLAVPMYALGMRHSAGVPSAEIGMQLAELAQRFPDQPAPWKRAAWLLEQQARQHHDESSWARAAEVRATAVQLDPLNAPWRVQLARDELAAGRPMQALAAAEGAIEVEANCADALALLAWFAARADNLDKARRLQRRAEKLAEQAPDDNSYAARILSLDAESRKMLGEIGAEAP